MKKNKRLSFGIALQHYNRYKRKYKKLFLSGTAQASKLDFLKKRIERLKQFLETITQKAKLAASVGALGLLLCGSSAKAQIAFGNSQVNPFGITNVGTRYADPVFADLDNDGDKDLIAGNNYGYILYYENTGTVSAPAFDAPATNPFGLTDNGRKSSIAFGDIDNDGDLDIIEGLYGSGNLKFIENTGTASAPAFGAPIDAPFGLSYSYYAYTPVLVDMDGDMDLDIVSGEYYGRYLYFENTGTVSAPAFANGLVANPFGLSVIAYASTPVMFDADGDGDFDMLSGDKKGDFTYFKNIGTAAAPAFAAPVANPFNLANLGNGSYPSPTIVDLNNDGKKDLLAGDYNGDFYYFQGCVNPPIPANTTPLANQTICAGNTAVLTGSGIGTVSWYDATTGGNHLKGGTSFTTPVLSSNTTYYFQDSTSCTALRIAVAVTVRTVANPTISIAEVASLSSASLATGGTASASTEYTSTNLASQAFDGDTITSGWGSQSGAMPAWLEYDFGTGNGKIINQYAFYCSSQMTGGWGSATYDPGTWTFEGYDGTSWVVLDTRSEPSPVQDIWNTYQFANTTSYEKYRVNISASPSNYGMITELSLFNVQYTDCANRIFVASTNDAANPATFQWKINGANTGTNSSILIFPTFYLNDVVSCNVSTTNVCVTSTNTALSNQLTMTTGPILITNNYSICSGDSVLVDGMYMKRDTTYSIQQVQLSGCDSTATRNVIVNNIDKTTSLSGVTITSNQATGTYQWLDCNNAYATIASATNQSYTATADGSYAVQVTVGSCVDTSACVTVTGVGINELSKTNSVQVYPNPNNGSFAIQSTIVGNYIIVNELGQTVQSFKLNSSNNYTINVEGLNTGLYYVIGYNNNQMSKQKIVVTK